MYDKFLGKPVSYWLEIDHWAKEHDYEDLIEEIVDLRAKLGMYERHYEKLSNQRELLYGKT